MTPKSTPPNPPPGKADPGTDVTEVIGRRSWAFDLLLWGHGHVLTGSDNGTLTAVAAIAFQQIRGGSQAHHYVACGFLLVSILFCGMIHTSIGFVCITRARRLIREAVLTPSSLAHLGPGGKGRRFPAAETIALGFTWVAAGLQMLFIVIGLTLLVPRETPAWMVERWPEVFQQQAGPGAAQRPVGGHRMGLVSGDHRGADAHR